MHKFCNLICISRGWLLLMATPRRRCAFIRPLYLSTGRIKENVELKVIVFFWRMKFRLAILLLAVLGLNFVSCMNVTQWVLFVNSLVRSRRVRCRKYLCSRSLLFSVEISTLFYLFRLIKVDIAHILWNWRSVLRGWMSRWCLQWG